MAFDKQVIIFLYAYLRQADLSIDRVRWTAWIELSHFYKDRLKPDQVIKILESVAGRESLWLKGVIRSKVTFDSSEYNILHSTLLYYQELIDQPAPTTIQIGTCSMWVKYLAYKLLEPLLGRSEQSRCMSPEHLMENPSIKTASLQELTDVNTLLKSVV
ncbi:hypothetical protein [Spirosoma koreense]